MIDSVGTPALYFGFTVLVIIMLAVDFVALRVQGSHKVSVKEAALHIFLMPMMISTSNILSPPSPNSNPKSFIICIRVCLTGPMPMKEMT